MVFGFNEKIFKEEEVEEECGVCYNNLNSLHQVRFLYFFLNLEIEIFMQNFSIPKREREGEN